MLCAGMVSAQDNQQNNLPGMSIYLPTSETRISIGFNYDLLRSPFDVSFEQPQGFVGFNIPIEQVVNVRPLLGGLSPTIDELFSDTTLMKNGEDFKPRVGPRQNPNITVRVDVPMLGGVASFSNIQNYYMQFQTLLGNPNILYNMDTSGINFLLRGTLNIPLDLSMSWETMSFGYAFEFNKWLSVAVGLHRHVFAVDLRGKVDADILGRYRVDVSQQGGGSGGIDIKPIEGPLDYSSERVHGQMFGYYDAAVWTPSLGLKMWRLSLVSRFGLKAMAKGRMFASYSLPFFIDPDPESFGMRYNLNDPAVFNDPDFRMGLQTNRTDSITYTTARMVNGKKMESSLVWTMPTGLTMQFDVIRDHFTLSYTKLFGKTSMKLDRIVKLTSIQQGDNVVPADNDSLVLDIGIPVDHVALMHVGIYTAYLNLGIFGMDFESAGRSNILGSAVPQQMRIGKMAMLPVVNLGTVLGTRWQLLFEADLLPLPAVRSGVFYNF
jgi:hypothetical protein